MTNNSHKVVIFITIIYLSVVVAFSIWHRIGLSPDQFFAVGLGLTLVLGRGKQFIRDWSLPIFTR
ncbi:MAG: hypothetical protein NT141_04030 [candidate division WWE3 bacterium]|nr:hypothetical protein [candidate division WWE3 bacterium]